MAVPNTKTSLTMENMPYVLMNVLGIALTSSAFLVYNNAVTGFPILESFFYFNLFALLGVFFLPLKKMVSKDTSIRWFDPVGAWRSWREGLKRGRSRNGYLALNVCAYLVYFWCVLTILQEPQDGVVLTLVVLTLLQPVVSTIVGVVLLKDKCENWLMFILGGLVTSFGVFLYKGALQASAEVAFFDKVFWLSLVIVVSSTMTSNVGAKYRRDSGVHPIDLLRSMFIFSGIVTLILLLMVKGTDWSVPNLEQMAALAYLGIVPTASSFVLIYVAQDRIGIPVSEMIMNLRSFFILLLSLVPLPWFYMSQEHLGLHHWIGLVLGVSGVGVVIFFASGKAGHLEDADETT
jgi:drug/metabolite transporter (DMT)-like permease